MGSIIGGKPRCGKTTELIKKSSEEWLYIVVATKEQAYNLVNLAKHMDLDIPYPITFSELPISPGSQIKGILIEEVERLAEYVVRRPVISMSTSYEMVKLNSLERTKNLAYELMKNLFTEMDNNGYLKGYHIEDVLSVINEVENQKNE